MASRKEDEKNERIIRALLKLPPNRKCLNCNSLGPQYVCTTFWTFICTACSGIHREFTHRVKSVSMANFTPQEVSSLQSGGNERAKEIYFKELDLQRPPDSSNMRRLRDFIKHVYVDRRYTGERSNDRPLKVKMGDKEETNEHRITDSYGSGSRSPPYRDTYERWYSERPSPGYDGRSPGSEQDNQRNSDYGRSPVRSMQGVVDDWRREDRFGNVKRSEDLRSAEGDSNAGGRSPDSQKDHNVSSSPVVRPVRDILGENATPIRVIEPPKVSVRKISEGYPHTQRTASSSSLVSSSGNPTEIKRKDSLIDFDADLVPPAAVTTQPKQSAAADLTNTTNSDNWACFENVPENKVSQPPPNLNGFDSVSQLSVPSPAPSTSATTPAIDSLFTPGPQVAVTLPNGAYAATPSNTTLPNNSAGIPAGNFSTFPSGGVPPFPASGVVGQWSNMQPQASSGVTLQPVEAKPSGRKELPVDIFTAMYAPQPIHAPAWQSGFVPHMVYPMQYNTAMQMPHFSQSIKSVNPFDASGESPYMQAPAFPSTMPLQAALPNMADPTGLARTSSLGTPTPSWMPSQAPAYPSATPQFTPSFATTAFTPGTYMSQQPHSNFAPRPQGFGGFGNDVANFNSMNSTLGFSGNLSAPAAPSSSRNPFG